MVNPLNGKRDVNSWFDSVVFDGSRFILIYPLVMTNSSPWYRWPIEIDGLPIKNGGSFQGEL